MDSPNLIDDNALQRSSVVANARMNRERGITGRNSYRQDLACNPLQFLHERLLARPQQRSNQTNGMIAKRIWNEEWRRKLDMLQRQMQAY